MPLLLVGTIFHANGPSGPRWGTVMASLETAWPGPRPVALGFRTLAVLPGVVR